MLTLTDLKPLLDQNNAPMLSLYLLVDPALSENKSGTPAWCIWIKNALKETAEYLPVKYGDVWPEIRAKSEEFLSSYVPGCKTLVLFFGQHSQQIYELPIATKNYASFGEPALAALIRAIDESKPFLLILASHDSARFFIVTVEGIQHQAEINLQVSREQWRKLTLMPASPAGGFGRAGSHRDRFADRIDEHVERFYRDVAEQSMRLGETYAVQQTVLAGNEKAAHAVHKHMPERAIIGPLAIAHNLSPSEILRQVAPIVVESRLEQDLTLVQDIIQLAKSSGRAALGSAVLAALELEVVELLLLPASSANEQFVDSLALAGLQAGVQVKLVSGVAAEHLIAECGIAARLYYRPSVL